MIVTSLASRRLSWLVAVFTFLGSAGAVGAYGATMSSIFGFTMTDPVSSGVVALTLGGGVVIFFSVFFGFGVLLVRVRGLERDNRDAALSAKYGVTVHYRHDDVWELDGVLQQARLTGDVLLVDGRELSRA